VLDAGTGRKKWQTDPRVLHGYITRIFWAQTTYGEVPTIEADMAAPAGVSGAPLIDATTREVVGVVYGSLTTTTAERDIDARNGEVLPARQRTIAFAGAHYTSTLLEARGEATQTTYRSQSASTQADPVPLATQTHTFPGDLDHVDHAGSSACKRRVSIVCQSAPK
jgi:hypothetical protein